MTERQKFIEAQIELDKDMFFGLFRTGRFGARAACEGLIHYGILAETVAEAVGRVSSYAANEARKNLRKAAVKRGYGERNLNDLSVREFTDVVCVARLSIYSGVFTGIATAMDKLESAFRKLKIDAAILEPIASASAEAIFDEITAIVWWRPLKGESLGDFEDLFDRILWFGDGINK
jgi:hypothetical protein